MWEAHNLCLQRSAKVGFIYGHLLINQSLELSVNISIELIENKINEAYHQDIPQLRKNCNKEYAELPIVTEFTGI